MHTYCTRGWNQALNHSANHHATLPPCWNHKVFPKTHFVSVLAETVRESSCEMTITFKQQLRKHLCNIYLSVISQKKRSHLTCAMNVWHCSSQNNNRISRSMCVCVWERQQASTCLCEFFAGTSFAFPFAASALPFWITEQFARARNELPLLGVGSQRRLCVCVFVWEKMWKTPGLLLV